MRFFRAEKGDGFVINNCAEDSDELVEGQRIRFDEQISPRNGKSEAVEVELL